MSLPCCPFMDFWPLHRLAQSCDGTLPRCSLPMPADALNWLWPHCQFLHGMLTLIPMLGSLSPILFSLPNSTLERRPELGNVQFFRKPLSMASSSKGKHWIYCAETLTWLIAASLMSLRHLNGFFGPWCFMISKRGMQTGLMALQMIMPVVIRHKYFASFSDLAAAKISLAQGRDPFLCCVLTMDS